MLGGPGDGFRVAMRTLDLFRPSVGASEIQREIVARAMFRAAESSR